MKPEDYDEIPEEKTLSAYDMMIVGRYLTLNDHLKLPKTCKKYEFVHDQYTATPVRLETGKGLNLFNNAEEVRIYDDDPSYELFPREHARIMVRFLLYMDAVCKELGYEEEYSYIPVIVTRTNSPMSESEDKEN